MAIRFLLSDDDDLIWDIDEHSEPLTEQQAMLVAFRQMGTCLGAIAEALDKIASRMEGRSTAVAAKPPKAKAAAKRKRKR